MFLVDISASMRIGDVVFVSIPVDIVWQRIDSNNVSKTDAVCIVACLNIIKSLKHD